jgi:hypothetical protein
LRCPLTGRLGEQERDDLAFLFDRDERLQLVDLGRVLERVGSVVKVVDAAGRNPDDDACDMPAGRDPYPSRPRRKFVAGRLAGHRAPQHLGRHRSPRQPD